MIADIDDNLWQLENGWGKQRLKNLTRLLKHAKAVTCSSKNLKYLLEAMLFRTDIEIIENSSPGIQDIKKEYSNNVQVGWTGAPWTRKEDVKVIGDVIKWIINTEGIEFVHIGQHPGKESIEDILDIPKNKIITKPLQSYDKYLSDLSFDIGLAPIKNNNFNSFKSDMKIVEYSSQGIPWIASECAAYNNFCESMNWKGRLCRTSNDWVRHCKQLLDKAKRNREGAMLQVLVQHKRSRSRIANQWIRIIEEAMNNN